jgi:hypothetical protein
MTLGEYLNQRELYQSPHMDLPPVEIENMSPRERRVGQMWLSSVAPELKAAALAEAVSSRMEVARVLDIMSMPPLQFVASTELYMALEGL